MHPISEREQYLQDALTALNLEKTDQLAEMAGVTYAHLRNVARGARDAGPELVARLQELVPRLDATVLAPSTLPETKEDFNAVYHKVVAAVQRHLMAIGGTDVEEVSDLFAAMQENDAFFYFGCDKSPIEMNTKLNRPLIETIADALEHGVSFVYVRPDSEACREKGVYVMIEEEFSNFKVALGKELKGLDETQKQRLLDSKVLLVQMDASPYHRIGMKWVLYLSDQFKDYPPARGWCLFPIDDLNESGSTDIRLPLRRDASLELFEHIKDDVCSKDKRCLPIIRGLQTT